MKYIKILLKSLREYKKPTLLTMLLMVFEVFIEVLIPFITANLVNDIKAGAPLEQVAKTGLVLVAMALVSLGCGTLGGVTCSKASAGFAKNLRHDIFSRVQDFSFENIDKFSSASLVTRMTTDINNVQMSFMMVIRTAIRSPLMFVFSVVMAFIMGGWLA
ncbi:MAG: ABC transporter ATP-binding protein, partial [Oscillospiraceae bacterium]|nr:ABC transporter ATP-binding protein [Oscillospiraceae bacterium]